MEEHKRAVLLKNISSPYVCEAVLIIRDCAPVKQEDIIKEAERLINECIFDLYDDEPCIIRSKRKSKSGQILSWMLAACGLAAAALIYIMMKI